MIMFYIYQEERSNSMYLIANFYFYTDFYASIKKTFSSQSPRQLP